MSLETLAQFSYASVAHHDEFLREGDIIGRKDVADDARDTLFEKEGKTDTQRNKRSAGIVHPS